MSETVEREPGSGQAYVVRLLDRVSVNAWLPAAFIGAATVFLLYAREQHSIDPMEISALVAGSRWQALMLFAPITVVSGVFIEASNAAVLAVLEGRWSLSPLSRRVRAAFLWWQLNRRRRIESAHLDHLLVAFDHLRPRLLTLNLTSEEVDFVRSILTSTEPHGTLSPDREGELSAIDWLSLLHPNDAYVLEAHSLREREFPSTARIRPTFLGNLLAAVDERLDSRYEHAPERAAAWRQTGTFVQLKLRDRMEILSGLLESNIFLAIASSILLPADVGHSVYAIMVAFVLLAYFSYRSMIATARTMLRTV